jgi:hypothetical protein
MSTPARVPDWLLERLSAGELPPAQEREIRERLTQAGETDRLSALVTSNAEILASLPPGQVVPEIERRARRATSTARAPRMLAFSLAATCAAGLAVFLLVRDEHGGMAPTPPSSQPEEIGIKGDPLRIHRKTGAGSELVRDRDRVRRGDILQLGYVAAGRRYGVIASIDARGTVTLHLPETPGPAARLERSGERALPHSFELDDSPGFERFVFVRSDSPFGTHEVTSALASGGVLPAPLAAFTITLTKETP